MSKNYSFANEMRIYQTNGWPVTKICKANDKLELLYQTFMSRNNTNMGSSICSKFRKWRKNLSKKRNVQEEKAVINAIEENRNDEEPTKDKLREIVRHEDDEMRVIPYTKTDLEELIAELEKELQSLWCNKPEREKLFLDLGHAHYKLCKFDMARYYYEQYFNVVKGKRSLPRLQRAYCNLGCVYRRLGDFVKAAEFLERGLAIAEELQDLRCQGRLYNNLGNICEMQKDFESAIYYHSKRRKIAEFLKDGDGEAKASASIANAHHCMGNLRKSIAYYERVVLWLKRKIGKTSIY